MLICLCRFQYLRRRIAEVHGTDFVLFGSVYLNFVPCGVVSHTAAHGKKLFPEVDNLPSQTAYLP